MLPKERLRIYKKVLTLYNNPSYDDMICCDLVLHTEWQRTIDAAFLKKYFPEMLLLHPSGKREEFWNISWRLILEGGEVSSRDMRISILSFCIAMVEYDIKHSK